MTSTISIRPYASGDLSAVLDLMRASLGETDLLRRTPEAFAWKHWDNPFGRSIVLLAEDGEGLVGLRAFMRWELKAPDGSRLRCVRAVDTATHPRAQRRGVFRRLTLEAVDAARDDGVDLIFNTPNPKSKAGYLTMGWMEVGGIGVLVRPRLSGLIRRAHDWPNVIDAHPWEGQAMVDRPPLGLRTPRTPEYLRWRFAAHPTAGYRIVDAGDTTAVVRPNLRNGRGELVVSDLFGERAARAVRAAARRTDAAYLAGWFSKGSPERRQALASGMLPVPGVTSLTLVARPLRDDPPLDVTRLESWDLALSDLELL